MKKQQTIAKPVSITGKGLHTGNDVTLTFKPAPENFGYVFARVDVENHPTVRACLENVVDTSRGTTIEENGVKIATIEHTLASLAGLSIDNVLMEIDGIETPIIDGSSSKIVEALIEVGVVVQDAPKKIIELDSIIVYTDETKKVEMMAIPADKFRVTAMVDYETKVLGTQFAALDDLNDFSTEIAPSRTFVFLHELEYLVENNLIKGGDLNNAIVFVNRVVSDEELTRLASIFNKPKVEVLREGILNNVELHFPNEPARHKLLDVIGDLALLGGTINAHIIAKRPGHLSNVNFAKTIAEHLKKVSASTLQQLPDHVLLSRKPLYDIIEIQKILPHRAPFLLIDRVIDMDEKGITGIKNVSMNETFFMGHFPAEPLMPGVLQIEAMAQCGGIFALKTVPDPENYLTLFLKIENARFKNKVVPGDTIVFRILLLSPIRRGICQMKGTASVNDKIVMEAELLAQLVRKDVK